MNSLEEMENLIKKLWNPLDPTLIIYRTQLLVTKSDIEVTNLTDKETECDKQGSLYIRPGVELYGSISRLWDNTLDTWYFGTEVVETNQPDEIKIALVTPRIIELLRQRKHD